MESSHHSCAGRRQARQSPRYITKRYGYNTDLRIVGSALERVPGRYFSRWKSLKFLQLLQCEVGSNHPIHRTICLKSSIGFFQGFLVAPTSGVHRECPRDPSSCREGSTRNNMQILTGTCRWEGRGEKKGVRVLPIDRTNLKEPR